MAETVAKRLKISPVTIGTHNGHFHADEALAVFMLKLLPTYQGSELVCICAYLTVLSHLI